MITAISGIKPAEIYSLPNQKKEIISLPKYNNHFNNSTLPNIAHNYFAKISFKGSFEDFDKIAEKAKELVKSPDENTKNAGLLLIESLPMHKAREFLADKDEDVILAGIKAVGKEKYNKDEALELIKPFLRDYEKYDNPMAFIAHSTAALVKLTFDKANLIIETFKIDTDKKVEELKYVQFTPKTKKPAIKPLLKSKTEQERRLGAILVARSKKEDINQLKPLLEDSRYPKVVQTAIEAIALRNDIKYLPLIKDLIFSDKKTAICAAKAIGQMGDFEYLMEHLEEMPTVIAEGLKKYLEVNAPTPECA